MGLKSADPRAPEDRVRTKSKARRSLAFWQAARLWLLVASASVMSLYVPGGSFVWPVALAAFAAALAPLGVRDELRAWGVGPPLWRLLRQDGQEVSLAIVETVSTKMAASAAQLPGLFFVTLCALALPIAPFQHGMLVAVALGASICVWPATASIAAHIDSDPGRERWSGGRWRQAGGTLAAACALILAFALVQSFRRPSPDGYWKSLVSVYRQKPVQAWQLDAYGALRAGPPKAPDVCDRRPRSAGGLSLLEAVAPPLMPRGAFALRSHMIPWGPLAGRARAARVR